jgi:hypothetical protein
LAKSVINLSASIRSILGSRVAVNFRLPPKKVW